MGGDVIACKNVSYSVGLANGEMLRILDGVSLTLPRSTTTAIVGTSGSGKTTLLSVLGLLQVPDSGRVQIDGQNVARLSDRKRSELRNAFLGYVFQEPALIDYLSVGQNVALPLLYGSSHVRQREVHSRVGRQLEAVGLTGFEKRVPTRLSGGEQQRVAVARALVRNPAVILADEPTGALDEQSARNVLTHLRSAVANARSALVVVTHDSDVATLMDRVYRIETGNLIRMRL